MHQWLFCELVMADSVLCITLCTESLTQSKTLRMFFLYLVYTVFVYVVSATPPI